MASKKVQAALLKQKEAKQKKVLFLLVPLFLGLWRGRARRRSRRSSAATRRRPPPLHSHDRADAGLGSLDARRWGGRPSEPARRHRHAPSLMDGQLSNLGVFPGRDRSPAAPSPLGTAARPVTGTGTGTAPARRRRRAPRSSRSTRRPRRFRPAALPERRSRVQARLAHADLGHDRALVRQAVHERRRDRDAVGGVDKHAPDLVAFSRTLRKKSPRSFKLAHEFNVPFVGRRAGHRALGRDHPARRRLDDRLREDEQDPRNRPG